MALAQGGLTWSGNGSDFIPGKTVLNYSALPAASSYSGKLAIVLNAQGVWLVNYFAAGIYYSDGATWIYQGDYTLTNDAVEISFAPAGNVTATNVQSAIQQLDTIKQPTLSISAANGSYTTNNLNFANSNGVSFSTGTQGIYASAVGGGGGGAAISAGTNSTNAGTVIFTNSNGISFGMDTNAKITASYTVPTQSVQPVAFSASGGSSNFSTLAFANSNGLTFSNSNGSVIASYTVPSQSTQPVAFSASGGSSNFSTLNFANSNGLTFSNSNGSVIGSYTVPTQTVQPVAFSASGGSSNFSTLNFANSNGLTFSNSNGSVIGSYTVPTQSNQTIGLYATSNTTQSSSGAVDARSLSFAGAGIASVGVTGNSVVISVPTGGGGGDGYNIVSMGSSGNSSGTAWSSLSASVGIYAAGALIVSQNNSNQIILSDGDGWKLFGNTFGTSSTAFGSADMMYFSGGQGINLSGNSNTIVISTTFNPISYYEPAVRGVSSSQSLANGTVYFQPFVISQNLSAYRGQLINALTTQPATTMSISGSVSAGNASSASGSWGMSGTLGLFSRQSTGTNANSSNIISFYSNSYSMGMGLSHSASWSTNASSATVSVTTSGAITYISNINSTGGYTTNSFGSSSSTSFSSTSTNANSFSSSFAMTFASQVLSGQRPLHFAMNTSLPPGEYWLGHIRSTSSGSTNQNLANVLSIAPGVIAYTSGSASYFEIGSSASMVSSNYIPGWGSYSASSNTTNSIPISNISNMSMMQTWFNLAAWTR
jgi:hypothetical protein